MKKCPKRIDKMFSKTDAAPQKTLPPQCCRMCPTVIPRSPYKCQCCIDMMMMTDDGNDDYDDNDDDDDHTCETRASPSPRRPGEGNLSSCIFKVFLFSLILVKILQIEMR